MALRYVKSLKLIVSAIFVSCLAMLNEQGQVPSLVFQLENQSWCFVLQSARAILSFALLGILIGPNLFFNVHAAAAARSNELGPSL
jgi:hypothetical protein